MKNVTINIKVSGETAAWLLAQRDINEVSLKRVGAELFSAGAEWLEDGPFVNHVDVPDFSEDDIEASVAGEIEVGSWVVDVEEFRVGKVIELISYRNGRSAKVVRCWRSFNGDVKLYHDDAAVEYPICDLRQVADPTA